MFLNVFRNYVFVICGLIFLWYSSNFVLPFRNNFFLNIAFSKLNIQNVSQPYPSIPTVPADITVYAQ